jgi:hypothetical protein
MGLRLGHELINRNIPNTGWQRMSTAGIPKKPASLKKMVETRSIDLSVESVSLELGDRVESRSCRTHHEGRRTTPPTVNGLSVTEPEVSLVFRSDGGVRHGVILSQ